MGVSTNRNGCVYHREKLVPALQEPLTAVLCGATRQERRPGKFLRVQYYKSQYVSSSAGHPDWPNFWLAVKAAQRGWKSKQKGDVERTRTTGWAVWQHRLTFKAA